jgi:acetyltransferase-like isoleucine patch superfamily enzyme
MEQHSSDIIGKLKSVGKGVVIYPYAKIVHPEVIEIGDYSRIDDFTFINGGKGLKIGRYVHVSSFSSIIGTGELILEDYVGLSAGVRIFTSTEQYDGGARMSGAMPPEQRNVLSSSVVLEKDVFVGTNAVIHTGVRIGEGAVIGSNSTVLKDIEPWTINVGSPCRKVGVRPKVTREDI